MKREPAINKERRRLRGIMETMMISHNKKFKKTIKRIRAKVRRIYET